ncbi:MAG TPA: hypothetical protein DEQ25_03510 [Methylophaga sp.]|nr:hypothetical protein [Methylophaga sp.]
MDWDALVWTLVFGVMLLLITRRWFWVFVFFVAGLACLFSLIASIIHFQILAAIGLFFLMGICFTIMSKIYNP